MSLPLIAGTSTAERQDSVASLEVRLRHIHQRRRRAAMRRFFGLAFWSSGLLAVGALVVAMALGVIQR